MGFAGFVISVFVGICAIKVCFKFGGLIIEAIDHIFDVISNWFFGSSEKKD